MKPPFHASTFRALLAAAVLAGGLAACGGRDNDRLGAHDALRSKPRWPAARPLPWRRNARPT